MDVVGEQLKLEPGHTHVVCVVLLNEETEEMFASLGVSGECCRCQQTRILGCATIRTTSIDHLGTLPNRILICRKCFESIPPSIGGIIF